MREEVVFHCRKNVPVSTGELDAPHSISIWDCHDARRGVLIIDFIFRPRATTGYPRATRPGAGYRIALPWVVGEGLDRPIRRRRR